MGGSVFAPALLRPEQERPDPSLWLRLRQEPGATWRMWAPPSVELHVSAPWPDMLPSKTGMRHGSLLRAGSVKDREEPSLRRTKPPEKPADAPGAPTGNMKPCARPDLASPSMGGRWRASGVAWVAPLSMHVASAVLVGERDPNPMRRCMAACMRTKSMVSTGRWRRWTAHWKKHGQVQVKRLPALCAHLCLIAAWARLVVRIQIGATSSIMQCSLHPSCMWHQGLHKRLQRRRTQGFL